MMRSYRGELGVFRDVPDASAITKKTTGSEGLLALAQAPANQRPSYGP